MPKPLILTEEQLRESLKAEKPAPEGQLRKAFVAEVKAMEEERVIDFVISTDTIDRMGDTIAVDGWQLANYRKNPVVLWAHDSYMHPIAKASNIRVEDGKLKARAHFVPAETPHIGAMAECTLQLLKGGFLNAVSVGFQPIKYAFSEDDGRTWGIDFLEQELLEFSVCPIPANPEALIEGRSAGIDVAPMRHWAAKMLAEDGVAILDRERIDAILALPEEFRAAAAKVPSSVKGARGLWLRCANLAEKAIGADLKDMQASLAKIATKAVNEDLESAISFLNEAIALHQGHMDGTVPTSEESQQELMDMIVDARHALTDEPMPEMSGGDMDDMDDMDDEKSAPQTPRLDMARRRLALLR